MRKRKAAKNPLLWRAKNDASGLALLLENEVVDSAAPELSRPLRALRIALLEFLEAPVA